MDSDFNKFLEKIEKDKEDKTENVYATLCKALDDLDVIYEKHPEKLLVSIPFEMGGNGTDIIISLNKGSYSIRLQTFLFPFTIPDDKVQDVLFAIHMINRTLKNGAFYFDKISGNNAICFILTECYYYSVVGTELFEYMLSYTIGLIKKYTLLFISLTDGDISLDELADII